MQTFLPNPIHAALLAAAPSNVLTHGRALRYVPGIIPFAAVPEPTPEALADLQPLLSPGEEFFLTIETGTEIPACIGLEVIGALPCLQMRFRGDASALETDASVEALTQEHNAELLALKAVAFPGFFGPRAPELGSFFGIRNAESAQLVAMGGERLTTPTVHEISALCTHPDHTGRGYAAKILRTIVRHQAQLGVESILHVAVKNQRAVSLYQHIGFETSGYLDFVKLRRV